jgi:hypothetical protein
MGMALPISDSETLIRNNINNLIRDQVAASLNSGTSTQIITLSSIVERRESYNSCSIEFL